MYVRKVNLLDKEYLEYGSSDISNIYFEKTNVFIGKNNSGKSRLMRKVLVNEFGKIYYVNDNSEDFVQLRKYIEEILQRCNQYACDLFYKTYLYEDKLNGKIYRNTVEEENLALFICNLLYSYDYASIYSSLQSKKIIKSRYGFENDSKFHMNTSITRIQYERIVNVYSKIVDEKVDVKPETIFFPSILSLRKLDNLDERSTYHNGISKLFRDEYFSSIDLGKLMIKTGQEIYHDMKSQLLGLNTDRAKFLEYEKYISLNFFEGKEISIFIRDEDNNIYVKEGNEEYPIFMLGDGLQTLITITYYLYMNSDVPLKVFIDEPEIHLHPGLQRLLISKLQEYNNCQFFISTHSSSMIDICDEYDNDTAIICVDKKEEQKVAYNSVYDDMNLYKLIGVRPSSIILANCTIWVEGPTDLYYIDSLLKLYCKKNKKRVMTLGYNYNYAFNGSINIASKFDFENDESVAMKISKISKNNFIIFDSDNLNRENENYKKITKIRSLMQDRCYVATDIKTIENIIPPYILKKYFDKHYNSRPVKVKKYVLLFFDSLEPLYGTVDYFKMDIADSMANYLFKNNVKYDIKDSMKYCNNLWTSNKSNLATFFMDEIVNMNEECQKSFFESLPMGFQKMIKNIYKFIVENN